MCYVHGRAAEVAAQAVAAGQSSDVALLSLLQRAYQPKIEPALRKLHDVARTARGERLGVTRSRLLLLHPTTIGLRQELVSSEEEPCYTVLGWGAHGACPAAGTPRPHRLQSPGVGSIR